MNLFRKIFLLLLVALSVSACFAQKKPSKKEAEAAKTGFDYNFSFYFLEGNKSKNLGDYESAIKYYTRALAVDNTQPAAYYELASILFATGDFAGAVSYAEKAVQYDKTGNVAYVDLLIFAYEYSGTPEKALPLYRQLISQSPNKIENYFALAQLYQKLKKDKEAIKVYNQAEKQFGIVDAISIQKELAYERLGNMEKSFEEMRRLRDAYPQNLRYKAMLAEAYYQNGKHDLAVVEFEELEKLNITEGLIYLSLAEYHRAEDAQYYKFFALLEKAFLCDDESLTFELKLQMLNQLLPAAKADDFVKVQLKRLVAIVEKQTPGDVALSALKADIAMMNNDYAEVQKNLMDIIVTDKSTYEIWDNLMSLDYHLKDFDNLYLHSKEASELFPNLLSAYQYYVVAAYLKQKFEDVVEIVDYASMLSIDNQEVMVDMLSMQGDAYAALKKYHEADSVYEYILFKDADYESVINNYSYSLAVRGEKLDRALELSTHLLELSPENPTYIDTHAWVLYRNGKLQEALEYIERAIGIEASNAVYYEHMGDIQFKIGSIDAAMGSWAKSLELNPDNSELQTKVLRKSLTE